MDDTQTKHQFNRTCSGLLLTAKERVQVAKIAAEEAGLPKTAIDAAQAAAIGAVCGAQPDGRGI